MSNSTELKEGDPTPSASEIVAHKIAASLVQAGLLDSMRAQGFEEALGQGKLKAEDLRFDLEQVNQ